jgi:WD40 repeat protein
MSQYVPSFLGSYKTFSFFTSPCAICLLTDITIFQVGSADHHIHYFDLRNPCTAVHIFGGHKKAVSYVKFLSNNELASASTDSTLRLWDVKDNCPVNPHRDNSFVFPY